MNRNLLSLVLAAASLVSCKLYQPGGGQLFETPRSRYEGNPNECSHSKQLRPVPGSFVVWEAVKVKKETGEEIPVTGSNPVDGLWKVSDNNLLASEGEFSFDISKTQSYDGLRDDRIMYVVFGLAQRTPLRFTIDSLTGTSKGSMPMPKGSAQEVLANGTLEIHGQKSTVQFPLIVKEQGETVTITPKNLVRLNVRPRDERQNTINLASHVERILTYVTGVGMKDEVTIDFNLQMKNICTQI